MGKTHFRKSFDSDYLNSGQFGPGEEKNVTITAFKEAVEVVGQGNQKSVKPCIYFDADLKPLVLNMTNAKSIRKATGSPYMEDWVGRRITLYVQQGVKAFGEIVDAVRVRPKAPVDKLPLISAERFEKMIEKIADGSFDIVKARKSFTFTKEQNEKLNQL